MNQKLATLVGLLVIPAHGAVLWSIGADDQAQDGNGDATLGDAATLNGVAFNVSGVQESGQDALPGNPANTGGVVLPVISMMITTSKVSTPLLLHSIHWAIRQSGLFQLANHTTIARSLMGILICVGTLMSLKRSERVTHLHSRSIFTI